MARDVPGWYAEDDGGFRWWDGDAWGERWSAPAGVYRSASGGPLRFWDGSEWRGRYWSWWRLAASGAVVACAWVLEILALPLMLGDPGPAGVTPQFEREKSAGVGLFLVVPVIACVLLLALNRRRLLPRHPTDT